MKKKLMKLLSVFLGMFMYFNCCSILSAFAYSNASNEHAKVESLLQNAYASWGLDEKAISKLRTTVIPAELYVYVDAANLPILSNTNDILTVSLNYNPSSVKYFTDSCSSIVTTHTVSYTEHSSSSGTVTGLFTMTNTSSIMYTGNIAALRFRANILGTDLHTVSVPTFNISNLLVGGTDMTALASYYISSASKIPGDVNCDGFLSDGDSTLLAQALAGASSLTVNGALSADVNRNGSVDTTDLQILIGVLSGTINHF